ncbi:hypothetical protein MPS_5026 [Mycobacterium pseudoshottsii JCM 15466]|nr:hypothetical protein MMSP_0601 [Mycobacterium sp. 012931]GAQ40091.1 hypothetical protein MPS_5026 [Mycobacterium pseudoshottsii JCM 15466]
MAPPGWTTWTAWRADQAGHRHTPAVGHSSQANAIGVY